MAECSLKPLVERLVHAKWILVFTGAGISTGSGIPDFRGPGGLWSRWKPVYYEEFLADREARVLHWKYKLETWKEFRDARPNAGHRALADLDRLGKLQLLVTQNIDGLHQTAGHPEGRVIELHGTNRWIECVSCRQRQDPDPVFDEFASTGEPPICRCGGFLKPATVSFGQAMPQEPLRLAFDGAQKADFVLSVGSTLEVEPAASVPRSAKLHGAHYAILNQGVTAHDHLADIRLEGDSNQLLPQVVEMLAPAEAEKTPPPAGGAGP